MTTKKTVAGCVTCLVRGRQSLCDLSADALPDVTTYPKQARLFNEGEQPHGVFVLCTGRAKLVTSSEQGRNIITRISPPGDVLGLSAVISNRPYEVSAEMMEPGQVKFISRDSLMRLMRSDNEVALGIADALSGLYYSAHEAVRSLGLATHPTERLAGLLLSWSKQSHRDEDNANSGLVELNLTHEEIGETIGATRETVSRLFSEFRKRQILQVNRSAVSIRNRSTLEEIAGQRPE